MSLPFAPIDRASQTVTVSSSTGATSGPVIKGTPGHLTGVRVFNHGTATVWIRAGDSTVTAATTDLPVGANPFCEVLRFPIPATGALYIAAIALGSTGDITFTPGEGV